MTSLPRSETIRRRLRRPIFAPEDCRERALRQAKDVKLDSPRLPTHCCYSEEPGDVVRFILRIVLPNYTLFNPAAGPGILFRIRTVHPRPYRSRESPIHCMLTGLHGLIRHIGLYGHVNAPRDRCLM